MMVRKRFVLRTTTKQKTMKTRLCFLNVQPHTLLVGQPGGFATAEDFHKWAAEKCGFEGVTMPSGFLDIEKAKTSSIYRDEFQDGLRKCGLKEGLVRLESHVEHMNKCIISYRVKKWAHFLDGENFRTMSVAQVETMASQRTRDTIDASAAFGFKDIPGFPGGRGFPAAMAKWTAWPKHLPLWVLALLAFKWNADLEYATDRGQTITFEFGHPENDLLTGQNFVLFYKMLTPKARKGVGINADWAHFLNVGIHPMPHMIAAASTGCRFTNHYKWGAVVERGQGGASMYGGWDEWTKGSTTFFTYATVGPDKLARDFHRFNIERATAQGDECLDAVYEGEDATIKNPKQAMEIGANNIRAADSGKPFTKVSGVVNNTEEGFLLTRPPNTPGESEVKIIGANDKIIPMAPWGGGPFDAAFDSKLKPWELLEMSKTEIAECRKILESAGYADAAKA